MDLRRLAAGVSGGALAILGPAIVHAFTDDPADQIALSLMIAGSIVVAVLVGIRRP